MTVRWPLLGVGLENETDLAELDQETELEETEETTDAETDSVDETVAKDDMEEIIKTAVSEAVTKVVSAMKNDGVEEEDSSDEDVDMDIDPTSDVEEVDATADDESGAEEQEVEETAEEVAEEVTEEAEDASQTAEDVEETTDEILSETGETVEEEETEESSDADVDVEVENSDTASEDEDSEEHSSEEEETVEEQAEEDAAAEDVVTDEEPIIEPPSDEGDEDIDAINEEAEQAAIEIGELEESADDKFDHVEELEEISEELEEVEDTLEAFSELPEVPAYASKMMDDKLRHLSRRLGTGFKTVSNESHTGDKYKDAIYVDSLESSVREIANQVWEAIKRLIDQALEQFKKLWSHITDHSLRINERAKKLKTQLDGKDFSTEGAEDVAKKLVENNFKAVKGMAIAAGSKWVIDEGYLADIDKLFNDYKEVVREDARAARETVSMYKHSGHGYADLNPEAIKEKFKKAYSDKEVAVPGGVTVVRKSGEIQSGGFIAMPKFSERDVPKQGLQDGLAKFAGRKGNLMKLTDFVIDATDTSAAVSKDYEKFQREYYKDLQAAIAAIMQDHTKKEKAGEPNVVDKAVTSALAATTRGAVRIGFSMTKEMRKQWLKALSSMTTVLTAYAKAGQKMQAA